MRAHGDEFRMKFRTIEPEGRDRNNALLDLGSKNSDLQEEWLRQINCPDDSRGLQRQSYQLHQHAVAAVLA